MQFINIIMYVTLTSFFVNVDNGLLTAIDEKTTIVVIEGKALLVDVNEKGEVIRRYMEVPEYFSSKKDHEEKVEAAKKKYEILKKHQIDQIRFLAFDESFSQLDENAIKHLIDVSNHYKQTYANQVIITAAKRASNEKLLDKMIQDVEFILKSYGVAKEDIVIEFKNDKGDEPMQFVKVQSNLR